MQSLNVRKVMPVLAHGMRGILTYSKYKDKSSMIFIFRCCGLCKYRMVKRKELVIFYVFLFWITVVRFVSRNRDLW